MRRSQERAQDDGRPRDGSHGGGSHGGSSKSLLGVEAWLSGASSASDMHNDQTFGSDAVAVAAAASSSFSASFGGGGEVHEHHHPSYMMKEGIEPSMMDPGLDPGGIMSRFLGLEMSS